MRELDDLHSISAENLFPDLPGFAAIHGATVPLRLKTAEEYLKEGSHFIDEKRHELAIASYTKAIALASQDACAYACRGYIYAELGNHQQAISDYNMAIKVNPKICRNLQQPRQ